MRPFSFVIADVYAALILLVVSAVAFISPSQFSPFDAALVESAALPDGKFGAIQKMLQFSAASLFKLVVFLFRSAVSYMPVFIFRHTFALVFLYPLVSSIYAVFYKKLV